VCVLGDCCLCVCSCVWVYVLVCVWVGGCWGVFVCGWVCVCVCVCVCVLCGGGLHNVYCVTLILAK